MTYKLSPSLIGAYFFHDCGRFLRWNSLGSAGLQAQGLPRKPAAASPVFGALQKSGEAWEQEVLSRYLAGRVHIAPGTGPLSQRRHSVEQTLQLLEQMGCGEFLYQGTLRASPAFYAQWGLDPDLVCFSDCHPDLIEKTPSGRLRVIDLKSSDALKLIHRVQVGIYALLLQDMLQAHPGVGELDLAEGGIWLGQQAWYTLFDFAALLPHLQRFFAQDLMPLLTLPEAEVPWHVWFRCEWCPWFNHCREQSEAQQSLSQLPYLLPEHRRYFENLPEPVRDLQQLRARLAEAGADLVAGSARLAGRQRLIENQTRALLKHQVYAQGGSSLLLPKGEHLSLMLCIEREPALRQVHALALHVRCKGEYREAFGLGSRAVPEVWLADSPAQIPEIQAAFVLRLQEILEKVHAWNAGPQEPKIMLQTYVYEDYELNNLTEMLLQNQQSSRPEVAIAASRLLFRFHSAALLHLDEHPGDYQTWPVIPLLRALRQLLALPVPLSWRLGDVLAVLLQADNWFQPHLSQLQHYPLSNYLNNEPLYGYWFKGQAQLGQMLVKALRNRAFGLYELLLALRHHCDIQPQLFLWPPPFALPGSADLGDAVLSRLFFMTWNEILCGALASRMQRTLPEPERQLSGQVLALTSTGNWRFRVERPGTMLSKETFFNWLFWPVSPAGEKAQLAFDDLARSLVYGFQLADAPLRTLVSLDSIETDPGSGAALGVSLTPLQQRHFLQGHAPEPGSRWFMAKRFSDPNALTVHKALERLSLRQSRYGRLLETVCSQLRPLPLPVPLPVALAEANDTLTASQEAAFETLCRQELTLVWGPPGTGKTHFIATAILRLARAYASAGRRFRVLIHAHSHMAIDNVLAKLVGLGAADELQLYKLQGESHSPMITSLSNAQLAETYRDMTLGVIGCTVWGYKHLKLDQQSPPDLIVVDEASQLTVPQGAIIWQLAGPQTRLLVVGDHFQLPPILQGEYPEAEGDLPLLHRSLFEAFQHSEHLEMQKNPELPRVVMPLLECFRMNQTLTGFAAAELYTMHDPQGRGYRCAQPAVAQRRLKWQPPESCSDLARFILDPDYPLVLCVLDGVQALRENLQEAALVAELALALRLGGEPDLPATAIADQRFWKERLFVVSPHHAQILALRLALAAQYDWQYPPFVDTVDKMQGQEAETVIVSYGVSDLEAALSESDFIYSLQRLNVSITRAKSKSVVFLSRPLLQGSPAILQAEAASRGWAFMQRLQAFCQTGQSQIFAYAEGLQLEVLRVGL